MLCSLLKSSAHPPRLQRRASALASSLRADLGLAREGSTGCFVLEGVGFRKVELLSLHIGTYTTAKLSSSSHRDKSPHAAPSTHPRREPGMTQLLLAQSKTGSSAGICKKSTFGGIQTLASELQALCGVVAGLKELKLKALTTPTGKPVMVLRFGGSWDLGK